jgi:hypothetical protein
VVNEKRVWEILDWRQITITITTDDAVVYDLIKPDDLVVPLRQSLRISLLFICCPNSTDGRNDAADKYDDRWAPNCEMIEVIGIFVRSSKTESFDLQARI